MNTMGKELDLDKDARNLYRAVSELVRAYQFRDRSSTCYYDLSVTQCYALSFIIRREAMTINALAGELFLDKSTTSRVAGSLVEKGYVHRTVDPEDARAIRLEATKKGQKLHARIEQNLVEEMSTLAADCDPETLRAATRLIGRLAAGAVQRFKS